MKKDGSVQLLDLIPILESIEDEKLYTTPLVEALKETAIMLNKYAFNWGFLPFLLQVIVCVLYFSEVKLNEKWAEGFTGFLAFMMLFMSTYFFVIEISQIYEQKCQYL